MCVWSAGELVRCEEPLVTLDELDLVFVGRDREYTLFEAEAAGTFSQGFDFGELNFINDGAAVTVAAICLQRIDCRHIEKIFRFVFTAHTLGLCVYGWKGLLEGIYNSW